MARALIHMPAGRPARRGDRDPRADRASDGDRLPPRRRRPASCRATSSGASPAATTASASSAPSCHPAIAANPYSPSTRWPPRAARSSSPGKATTASRRPRRSRCRVNEHDGAPRAALHRDSLPARIVPAPSPLRPTAAAAPSPAPSSWAQSTQAMQRDDTQNPAHAVGAATAKRCGAEGRRQPASPAPTATATPRAACAASPPRYPDVRRSRPARPVDLGPAHQPVPRAPPAGCAVARRKAHELLGLESYVATAVARHAGRAGGRRAHCAPFARRAAARSVPQRIGQLNLSCAQCHDRNCGQAPGRRADPAGPCQRLSDLPARMAVGRARCSAACATA